MRDCRESFSCRLRVSRSDRESRRKGAHAPRRDVNFGRLEIQNPSSQAAPRLARALPGDSSHTTPAISRYQSLERMEPGGAVPA